MTRLRAADVFIVGVLAAFLDRAAIRDGKLFGDIGDARWTVAIYEHWWDFFRGFRTLRDTGFYAPYQSGLSHCSSRAANDLFGRSAHASWDIAPRYDGGHTQPVQDVRKC